MKLAQKLFQHRRRCHHQERGESVTDHVPRVRNSARQKHKRSWPGFVCFFVEMNDDRSFYHVKVFILARVNMPRRATARA